MKFWAAMKIIDEGGKVRRKDWGNYLAIWTYSIHFWEKVGGKWHPMYQADDCLTSNDMMAEDWEVVDPAPTGREEVMLPNELKLYNDNIDGF